VDLSQSAVDYAGQHYNGPGIQFVQEDAMRYWDTAGFTNIVSLGTLEYLSDPRKFLMRTAGMLRNHGTFVASAPVTPSMDSNPRHQNDFTESDLRAMARECDFEEVAAFPQAEPFDPSTLSADYYKSNPIKLLSRIGSTLRNGFKNRYLTIAWTKRA
jgi:SAM-dependent methyltransferase